jgi:DNA-directed RNA polymerase specialized sigma24 family protein
VREVASALEIPEGTVKSRLHRARLRLQHHLRPNAVAPAQPSLEDTK